MGSSEASGVIFPMLFQFQCMFSVGAQQFFYVMKDFLSFWGSASFTMAGIRAFKRFLWLKARKQTTRNFKAAYKAMLCFRRRNIFNGIHSKPFIHNCKHKNRFLCSDVGIGNSLGCSLHGHRKWLHLKLRWISGCVSLSVRLWGGMLTNHGTIFPSSAQPCFPPTTLRTNHSQKF